MNVCTNCNTIYYEGDKYCGKCGVKLASPDIASYMTSAGLNVAEVRSNLGIVYFKMGRFEEALNEFKKVLSRNPNDGRSKEMIRKIEEKLASTK